MRLILALLVSITVSVVTSKFDAECAIAQPKVPHVEHPSFGYAERAITFRTDDTLPLYGTLTLPTAGQSTKHRWPCVVMVHGSGPQDRDEAVVVFRYDTSFKNRPHQWAAINIDTSSIEEGRKQILQALLGKESVTSADLGHYITYK